MEKQVRKSIINEDTQISGTASDTKWMDLANMASVELTSEDKAYPIEGVFTAVGGSVWRAQHPGKQTICLVFDKPCNITHIHLVFQEYENQRTQEFLLRWSTSDDAAYRDVVRQQYNFSPPENSREVEDYVVDLIGVTRLELSIVPNISGGDTRASLEKLLLA
jgi:hypothetical protein